jgi:ATP-dependent DNA ligase
MARIVRRSAGLGAAKRSSRQTNSELPRWIEPQLCELVEKAPSGPGWVHEVKFDGYRMAARINHGNVQLLTRSGLDWTEKYPETADALAKLPVATAYIDGELCGVRDDGVTSFELMQQATDRGTGALVYFPLDLPDWMARRPRNCR